MLRFEKTPAVAQLAAREGVELGLPRLKSPCDMIAAFTQTLVLQRTYIYVCIRSGLEYHGWASFPGAGSGGNLRKSDPGLRRRTGSEVFVRKCKFLFAAVQVAGHARSLLLCALNRVLG